MTQPQVHCAAPAASARGHASPARSMSEMVLSGTAPWSRDETVMFLNELLENERAGARALAYMAHQARHPGVRALLREVEAVQAAFCVTLWQEIEARGEQPSPVTGRFYQKCLAQSSFKQRIGFANRGQEGLARRIKAVLPSIPDSALRAKLQNMLDLHQQEIERWKFLLG